MKDNIYEYVKAEENSFKSHGITVADGYEWHMHKHITQCVLYKDGRFLDGNSDDLPVKNIILPIVNVAYRSEGFDVKDIEPYVDSDKDYHKSFLVRKFHDKWARKYSIDTFIDDVVESYVDFGGALVKNVKGVRPEVIPLQKIAFCDQTDFMAGPFAIKHQYSVDQLREKADSWNAEAVNEIIEKSRMEKPAEQSPGMTSKTTGKYIEVYEIHGMLPTTWLTKDTNDYLEDDEHNFTRQIQIISFYTDRDNRRNGVTLFKGKEKDGLFKLIKRDKRFGTALGRSAIEELFEPQVWTNYNMAQQKRILDKAAILVGVTDDPGLATRNKITDLEVGEWIVKSPNSDVQPFIFPTSNIQQFEQSTLMWEDHARTTGSANEAALGVSPSAGTPFKLQDLVVAEGRGIHDYRRGQIAVFMAEIYRDWVLPYLAREMNSGQEFIAELTLDELEEVAERVIKNGINDMVKKAIISGRVIPPEQVDAFRQKAFEEFKKNGTKRFLKMMQGDFDNIPLDVKMNIAGKQRNLEAYVDKISNVVRQLLVNPAALQDKNIANLVNTLLESSGISPINVKPQELPVQGQPQGQNQALPIGQPAQAQV